MKKLKLTILILYVLFASIVIVAQPFENAKQLPLSPEIHSDRTVTFRLFAPNADSAHLVAGGLAAYLGGPKEMVKVNDSIFEIKVGPLDPDIYDYGFSIGGSHRTIDPSNPYLQPLKWGSLSYLEIPADKPQYYHPQEVPHGTVESTWYHSKVIGGVRPLNVYLPPGYHSSNEKYPVLYLLHGAGQNERLWVDMGKVNFILDNLIASGKAKPMIIVMPYGHLKRELLPIDTTSRENQLEIIRKEMIEQIIPYAENKYRIVKDKNSRAIAGLSMGSRQSYYIALKNTNLFNWCGVFSGSMKTEDIRLLLDNQNKDHLKLVWMGVSSNEPFRLKKEEFEKLDAEIEPFIFHSAKGGHTFVYWRQCINLFLPLLY